MLVSLGKNGSIACTKNCRVHRPTYVGVKTIETTGAGDTFCGCVLNYVLEHGLSELENAQLGEMLDFANAAASIVTTKRGALRIMPKKAEIEALMKRLFIK
jgi:fructokinase